jgi:Phosphotransferase enzyme family
VQGADATASARSAGMSARRLLPLPRLRDPVAFVSLGDPEPARYALHELLVPTKRWKEARNRALLPALSRGMVPGRLQVTVAAREHGVPFLIEAARRLGTPEDARWLLSPGRGDVLARGAFHLFPPGSDHPSHVLKFSRVPGRSEPFDRDEHGLGVAASAGAVVAPHAPRLLGRIEEAGVYASVETAARGRHLIGFLVSDSAVGERMDAVEEIAEWLIHVAVATASEPPAIVPEIERLARDVLPAWRSDGATPDLLEGLSDLPAVLQHNDLGSWNLVITHGGFTAVDWESARRHGLPLWDIWYLLSDALAHIEGVSSPGDRERHFVRLFRGELRASQVLFEWTRRAAEASGVPPEAIGRIATLCWLSHGLSPATRLSDLHTFEPGMPPPYWLELTRRLALAWLREPGLGPRWDAYPG